MDVLSQPIIRRRPLPEFLRLVRIWNLPTAVVDSFAGYLIVAGFGEASAPKLAAVMLISALLYSAGMVWNDLLDLPRDRTLHPDRPLPSGAIRKKSATRLGLLLIVLGLAAASFLGLQVLLLTAALVMLSFTYNAWLKHRGFAGCLNMGACRSLNMLIGIAAAGGSLGLLWPFPATLGLYVASLTLLSLQEEEQITTEGFFEILSLLLIVLLPFAWFSLSSSERSLALVPVTLLAGWLFAAGAMATRSLTPASIGSVVRVAVSGIILLDAAFLVYHGRLVEAVVCAAMLAPSLLLVRLVARQKRRAPLQFPV